MNLELDIDQELSEIPPEYQDIFRQTIMQELAESEKDRTDTDILHYLRQRRDHFKRGGFIRPDGRPGSVTLNPETMYEQALPQLARNSLGKQDETAERKRTLIKLGAFVGLGLLLLIMVFRGRAERESEVELVADEPLATEVAEAEPINEAPPLPEITDVEDSLQTIGNLGGALTIGRPSAIEITYGRTEETIALAIDPSKATPKGELRFNESTMLSDNPVAVWLFGTVLNYAIGLPDSLVRNLETEDRLTISTDTGATLHFVVTESRQGASYEAGRILSQNRLGLTLFSLPAGAEDDVAYVFASYDFTDETGEDQPTYQLEEAMPLSGGGRLMIKAAHIGHDIDGNITVAIEGSATDIPGEQTLLLSLAAGSEQSATQQIVLNESQDWQAVFTLPNTITGLPLLAELRLLPGNVLPEDSLVIVALGEVPQLLEQVRFDLTTAWWEEARTQVIVTGVFTNTGTTSVYLSPDIIQIPTEGGDAYEPSGQVTPNLSWQVSPPLPFLINPGETVGITVTFLPQNPSLRFIINADLWEIANIPFEVAAP